MGHVCEVEAWEECLAVNGYGPCAYSDAEETHGEEFFAHWHDEFVEIWHGHSDEDGVGDEIHDAHCEVEIRLTSACSRYGKVPVSRQWAADEKCGHDVCGAPHYDEGAERDAHSHHGGCGN